jgi:NAD(P)-dependent dehydrogenase (short-subunit alcohol dehydrogenase family)
VNLHADVPKKRKVDFLVNAAGITHYSALFATKPELLEEVAQTNLIGTILGCRSIGRLMMGKKNDGGG